MKKWAALYVALISVSLISTTAWAADSSVAAKPDTAAAYKPTKTDMKILNEKISMDKKLLVASNMQLTDAEAAKFWPLYDEYQTGLGKLNKRMSDVIANYAKIYDQNSMTDDKAKNLLDEALLIEQDEAQLKRETADKMEKVLPAIKVARYIQIENKIRAIVRYELAGRIPLVE